MTDEMVDEPQKKPKKLIIASCCLFGLSAAAMVLFFFLVLGFGYKYFGDRTYVFGGITIISAIYLCIAGSVISR